MWARSPTRCRRGSPRGCARRSSTPVARRSARSRRLRERGFAPAGGGSMSGRAPRKTTVGALDGPTRALVRLAARIAAGTEGDVRSAFAEALAAATEPAWVEEVILQSYLFAGFPRALNAAREWRRIGGHSAPDADAGERYEDAAEWRSVGARADALG